MRKSLGVLIVFIFLSQCLFAQQVIKGQVIDAEDKEPLVGASIILKGDGGTYADLDGFFILETEASSFEVSYIGYKPQTIQLENTDSLIIIELEKKNVQLPTIIFYCDFKTPPYKVPTHISELSKKDLQINSEASITPSLNRIPGVFMHSGALNTNRITIRGIGNRSPFATAKIKAYIDNIPLTNGSGETTIEDIDLSIIDQVNVFKGPTSSIYGAGLGGMIYLKTADSFAPKTNLSVSNTFGSYGLTRNIFQFDHSKDGDNQLSINANNTQSDGYRDNNSYKRQGVAAIGKFKLNENEKITIIGNYSYLSAEIPSSLDSTDFVDNPTQAAFTWARARGFESTTKALAGGSYFSNIGEQFSQISSIYTSFRDSYENRPFNILREKSFVRGARTEWTCRSKSSGRNYLLEIRIGTEFLKEDYDWLTNETDGLGAVGDLLSDNQESRLYANAFSQMKLELSKLAVITVGLNVNRTDYHVSDIQNSQKYWRIFPFIWSPSLSIGYNLSKRFPDWSSQVSLHALISHGFSPPTLEETLAPDGTVNPDILPEQGWNFEFGSRGTLLNGLDYNISFYSMHIDDLLVARRTALDQYIGINAGKTIHNGLELELDYKFQISNWSFQPYLNYTYADYRFEEFIDDQDDFSGNELTGTAPHQVNAGFSWNCNNNFYGNLYYQYIDAMPMRDDNSIYSDTYDLMNLKLGYRFKIGKRWRLDCFAGINNLWNEKYASMILINASGFGGNAPRYYYPGLPGNYYGGLKVSINLKK